MKTILVVDDEAVVRKLARRALTDPSCEVIEASEGESALQLARARQPDLVLLDVHMPGMSGFDVCRALKAHPLTATAKVVLLTGEALEDDQREGRAAGATDIVGKPFEAEHLKSCVWRHLDRVAAAESSSPASAAQRNRPSRAADGEGSAPPSTDDLTVLDRDALVAHVHDLRRALADEQSRTHSLRTAMERGKAAEMRRDHFVSLVSHGLLGPLASLRDHVGLLREVLDSTSASEDLRQFFTTVTASGQRLEALVDELRDFARTSCGTLGFERKDVHLPAMIRLLGQDLLPAATSRGLHVEVEVSGDIRSLRADAERLREALAHLLRHALDHTPRGGGVRITCIDEGRWVELRIADGGDTLQPDERERLLRPFPPARRVADRHAEAADLQISIARHIIEAHGGLLSATSAPSAGVVFVVRLPRSYDDARAMVSDICSLRDARGARLADALHEAESRLLSYAQELAVRLSRETVRAERLEAALSDMEETYLQTIAAIANAADEKDAYRLGHTERVTFYACSIAAELSPALLQQREFKYSLLLHDLGKIGIAEELLKKAGRLSDDEWETVKSHAELGARLLSPVRFLAPALASVRSHHERFDGKGYPDGLRGEEIPLPARIIAVADAFEAMTSDRPYRAGLSPQEARDQIRANSGTQFDPQVVEAFLRSWPRIEPRTRQGAQGRAGH